MIKLWKPIWLTFLLLVFSAPALAQFGGCMPRDAAVKELKQKYQEVVIGTGTGTGNSGPFVAELWISENKSWTLLITRPDKTSCLAASGKNWNSMEPEFPVGSPIKFLPIASSAVLENIVCKNGTIEKAISDAPESFREVELSPSETATVLSHYGGRRRIDEVHIFIAPTPAGKEMAVFLLGSNTCASFSLFRDISLIEEMIGRSIR